MEVFKPGDCVIWTIRHGIINAFKPGDSLTWTIRHSIIKLFKRGDCVTIMDNMTWFYKST